MIRRTTLLLPFCLIAVAFAMNGVSGTGSGFRFVGWGGHESGAQRTRRSDYCRQTDGFAVIDVSGSSFTVRFSQKGESTPAWQKTFAKIEKGGKQVEITVATDGKIVDSERIERKHLLPVGDAFARPG